MDAVKNPNGRCERQAVDFNKFFSKGDQGGTRSPADDMTASNAQEVELPVHGWLQHFDMVLGLSFVGASFILGFLVGRARSSNTIGQDGRTAAPLLA